MSRATGKDDDAALVARCIRGDSAAWSSIVQRYKKLVYAIVRRMGLDEHMAADVFQTVFVRLLEHLPRIDEPGRLQAWIVTTAKREALLQRSKVQRTVSIADSDPDGSQVPDRDLVDESPDAEEAIGELQRLHQVYNAIDRLDERCRDLILLLFSEENENLGYEEVARRMGMTVGSIGPTRSRCLEKLRALVTD